MTATALAAPNAFCEGEFVQWTHRELDGSTTTRHCIFDGPGRIETEALIRWGQDPRTFGPQVLTVPLAELRRPQPTPIPDYLKPPANWAPNQSPSRAPLPDLRNRLRQAHEEMRAANEAVIAAEAAADRAAEALSKAQAALARFAERDKAAAERLTDALRAGTPTDTAGPPGNADRQSARRRCTAAESAVNQLNAELAAARAHALEADRRVRATACAVLVGVAEREGDALAAIDADAARRRATLDAFANYWPQPTAGDRPAPLQVSTNLAKLISEPSSQIVDPPIMRVSLLKQRQAPWHALYDQLVAGSPEADLANETPAEKAG